jgi:hypothetical protein
MRYQSLLLSGLFMSLISLPIPAHAQSSNSLNYGQPVKLALSQQLNPQIVRAYDRISAGVEGRNINQIFAYAAPEYIWTETNGRTRNLQQAIQTTSGFLQSTSNIKFRIKVSSISYSGQYATVSGTVYHSGFDRQANNSYSLERRFQDTWQRTNNGWTWISQRDLSQNIAVATPRQRGNSTRQTPAQTSNSLRTFNLAQEAVDNCYREKKLAECRKLDDIRSTLVDLCVQGDRESCVSLEDIRKMLANTILY